MIFKILSLLLFNPTYIWQFMSLFISDQNDITGPTARNWISQPEQNSYKMKRVNLIGCAMVFSLLVEVNSDSDEYYSDYEYTDENLPGQ